MWKAETITQLCGNGDLISIHGVYGGQLDRAETSYAGWPGIIALMSTGTVTASTWRRERKKRTKKNVPRDMNDRVSLSIYFSIFFLLFERTLFLRCLFLRRAFTAAREIQLVNTRWRPLDRCLRIFFFSRLYTYSLPGDSLRGGGGTGVLVVSFLRLIGIIKFSALYTCVAINCYVMFSLVRRGWRFCSL